MFEKLVLTGKASLYLFCVLISLLFDLIENKSEEIAFDFNQLIYDKNLNYQSLKVSNKNIKKVISILPLLKLIINLILLKQGPGLYRFFIS